jgi:MEMO1 family protein
MAIRRPAVAGAFYASSPEKLREQITNSFKHKLGPGRLPSEKKDSNILSVVCPHAGYVYSGPAAAHCYLSLGEQHAPETVVIIGPNHTGFGTSVSVMTEGAWSTPLGEVKIDSELAEKIIEYSDTARKDDSAFVREHSVEVQLPFLQFIYQDFKFVPICMGRQDLKTSKELGKSIYEASEKRDVILVASTDLTHQETKEVAKKQDRHVLDAILDMDEELLHRSVKQYHITTCGYGPVSATLVYSKLKKATKAEILTYYTSGDIIGDNRAVVGYASAKITKER